MPKKRSTSNFEEDGVTQEFVNGVRRTSYCCQA